MINTIFKNYEAFYNMVLSTTIMSNSITDDLLEDGTKIIHFIAKSYGLDDEFGNFCSDLILNHLSRLGTTTDQQAVYASRKISDVSSDYDSLFDIKGDVLATLEEISKKVEYSINPGWFDYSHFKSYQSDIRFSKIYITSASGNLIATRQIGILYALGIGCEKSFSRSIERLLQCARWGDIPSMHYLAYVYAQSGDLHNAKLYSEIVSLSEEYLRTGITVLPESARASYSDEACTNFAYIATILQDVIYLHKATNINFSFLEAIFNSNIDHYTRLGYINNYSNLEWKNVTNSCIKPMRLGFTTGDNKND